MRPRLKRNLTPPVPYFEHNPDDEEVFSIHTISSDDTPPSPPRKRRSRRVKATKASDDRASQAHARRGRAQDGGSNGLHLEKRDNGARPDIADVEIVTISDAEEEGSPKKTLDEVDDEDIKLEEVEAPLPQPDVTEESEELGMEFEEVGPAEQQEDDDHSKAYAEAYEAAVAQQGDGEGEESARPIFKDGKGQLGGISVSLSTPAKKAAFAAKRNGITTKDRQTRMAVHKWTVLCLIAHTKRRNLLINDEDLRDKLYALIPNNYLEKLRLIHPKKVPTQNERVRLFEAFLRDLTRWWSFKFRLDPNLTTGGALRQPSSDLADGTYKRPGVRVDGWIVESAKEREDRHREERKAEKEKQQEQAQADEAARSTKRKGKGKGKAVKMDVEPSSPSAQVKKRSPFLSEITLFGSGSSTTPVFLRLASGTEVIERAIDLEGQLEFMYGSRETKAQLFASLCRALGIPCRLVVSIQTPSWSVSASKVASSIGAVQSDGGKESNLIKKKRALGARNDKQRQKRQVASRAIDAMTSDDEGFSSAFSIPGIDSDTLSRGRSRKRKSNGSASRPMSVASTATAKSTSSVTAIEKSPLAAARRSERNRVDDEEQTLPETAEESSLAKDKNEDYRDEKWKDVDGPLEVKYEPKLRIQKPKALKASEIGADTLSDVEPVDASAPPTMWVEVFSKPWQRWITVDPVRGLVEPTGNRQMEPVPSDKSNRLIYVVAFEEDGYARDVTARYTKTLNSRVNKMRPPPVKVGGQIFDWWAKVVETIHRPQKLERDAIEDVELEGAAAKEPMPSSVAAFKEHPVYTLEKHLKRDEVIFPPKQAGTFQGMPVFLKANVVACRSARQWYNQGKVVKDGEVALKWVKSRGYTIANKRAEEEARMQGQEALQEGLYALFQTELYRAPPVVDGSISTNSFGNIDLFVDTMLPEGAAHVPYSGAVRVAKKLGIQYAEAITGFEFRKHRSNPKMTGVVIAIENEEMLLEALEEDQHMTAEKEYLKKQERLFKNWKKLLNSLKIQERIQREYGEKQEAVEKALSISTAAGTREK
ncbi:hypothetical protein CBS101457_006258 [Exobasidium rhododendri]|nr:hypothetical protein CBS101457_006258 [Exobasidium rhododendri]